MEGKSKLVVQLTELPGLKRIYVSPPEKLNNSPRAISDVDKGIRCWIPNQNYEIVHGDELGGVHGGTKRTCNLVSVQTSV